MAIDTTPDLRMMIRASLFTALIIVGTYVRIPIGPVPIALSSFFVLSAGLLLGARWAAASVGVYLLLGAVGLPVFSGGGGLALFAGPTGGYLAGYLPAAFVTGFIACRGKRSVARDVIGLLAGTIVIYLMGLPWLNLVLDSSWPAAVSAGLVPFLLGDSIKIAAAASLRKILQRYTPELFPALANQRTESPI
jgi:biotin transport system substrate-specific component